MGHRSVRVGHKCLLTVAATPTSTYGNKVRVPQPAFHSQHKISLRQHFSFKDCYFGTFAKLDSKSKTARGEEEDV